MANPQIEHGHTRIANEILEQIAKTNLNGTQFRIVMVIWRYTYGFQRKQHELSNAFISQAIGIKNRAVIAREVNVLVDRKIISAVGKGSRGTKILSFNKNYETWTDCTLNREQSEVFSNQSTEVFSNQSTEVFSNQSTEVFSNQSTKKEIKKNIKKYTRQQKTYDEDNTYFKMATYFFNKVSVVAKEAGVEHLIRKADLQKWADDFRKLIELDGVDKRLAKDVMDWVTKDPFWKTNVLSAKKLREKFGELAIKMKNSQTPKQPMQSQQPDIRDKEIAFSKWVADGNDPDAFDWS